MPVYLYFSYEWMHLGFLFLVQLQAVSNGADFYFQIFTDRYKTEVREAAVKRAQDIKQGIVKKKTVPRMVLIGLGVAICVSLYLVYVSFK